MRCKRCKDYGFIVVQDGFMQEEPSEVLHEKYRCETCDGTGWLIQEPFGIPQYTGILEGDTK